MLVASVIVTFRDAKKKESFTKIRIPTGIAFSDFQLFAQGVAEVLKAMTTCEITSVNVAVGLDLSGASLKTVATQFADWWNKGFIQARNAINGAIAKFNLPTWDELNNASGSRNMNLADADVIALTTLITDGVDSGGTLIYPVSVRGDALSVIDVAVEAFRQS